MTNDNAGPILISMTTTIETKANETHPEILNYRCTECYRTGVSTFQSGRISHRKDCSSRAQPVVPQASSPVATAPAATTDDSLLTFARNVRAYGQTKGRDADVLAAVRTGYLSVSDAMNTDD